ncbi:hypothetical protein, partial [Caulobacter sp. 17J65-9]|uniref:hypothetical protein n=1 Tax=Caulobacter sp. 17J65-9 TaxID=2709382 RepID=UPI001969C1D6
MAAASHHRFLLYSLLAAVLGLSLAGGGYWGYWNYYARFQPVLITKNQSDIQKILDESGWVSPGDRTGPWLYVVGWRNCDACSTYEREEFPKLRAAGVDTRVIVFAREEREGLVQSTPSERATVAALWLDRDWALYQRWKTVSSRAWTAEGLKPADGDIARTAVVNATGATATQLQTYLRGNNVDGAYPMVLWRDPDGYLKACACADKRSWHFIRKDLGAPDKAPKTTDENAVVAPPVAPSAAPAAAAAPA